jgi:hypothetical protein
MTTYLCTNPLAVSGEATFRESAADPALLPSTDFTSKVAGSATTLALVVVITRRVCTLAFCGALSALKDTPRKVEANDCISLVAGCSLDISFYNGNVLKTPLL